ncbi:LytR family transcriptional regulator [Xylanimonas oleitrophica]|uniref:LytR family transcriptional regulator n=2 Tax=Xylanimonas oleitrophica TaxID=2607479 RepID=A0A2W5X1X9_9MICO|nr:LytR family transcriptional regulator [Xylanimonas oleitrophica]
MVATGALTFGVVGGATAAVTLTGNIDGVDADALLGQNRPEAVAPADPNAGTPLNIVLMGSDSRDGDNAEFASSEGTDGARSDTTMIMHISADRERVELVSIPRDSTVNVPSCPTTNGRTTSPLRGTKFNSAFAQGVIGGRDIASGALCTVATIESLTDVRMDGFVVIDFAGFQRMIDAIGGVEMCIPEYIDAPEAGGLVLHPGVQKLNGNTALQYARARKGAGLGDGSDLGRIGRQQELMAALARTVLSKNLLTDSPALLRFLGAVTGSLTMSDNFASVQGLAGLAYSIRDVRPDTITFMTVPYAGDPRNPANVVWTDEADVVWENLKYDRPVDSRPDEQPAPGATDPEAAPEAATDGAPAPSEPTASAAAPEPAESPSAAPAPEPSPTETKQAGREAFTGADVTSVCG